MPSASGWRLRLKKPESNEWKRWSWPCSTPSAWYQPKQAVRAFEKLGSRSVRESGHLILSNGERRLVIPRHDPINAITMGAIARDAGLTPQQFRDLL